MRLGPYFDQGGASGTVDAPAAAPAAETPVAAPAADATPTPPRDPSTGRFTKAAIEAKLGITPATAPVPVTTPAPVTAASTASTEASSDTSPEAAATPATIAEDDFSGLDAFLAANPVDTAPAAAPPAAPIAAAPAAPVTPEIQTLEHWRSDPALASEAVRAAQTYALLNNSLSRGDFNGALGAFHPTAVAGLVEHIFQQNKEAFLQRLTDEANGAPSVHPIVQTLQQQVQEMQNLIKSRDEATRQAQQQRIEQQRAEQQRVAMNTYLDKLRESTKLAADSPKWAFMKSALIQEVMADPEAVARIRAGKFGDFGIKFRDSVIPKWRALQTPATTPQVAAPQPNPSSQLMTAAAGTSSTASDNRLATSDGRINTKNFTSRLKSLIKAV